ncbi:MAG: hypothetical protein HY960_06740 [Ignavibacteriae bacterium]|nr:hypothetical protein [Ignavibacteriota bacterium]
MNEQDTSLRVDRNVLVVTTLESEPDDKMYWLRRTPEERLEQVELLRRINYGDEATSRLQRFFEVVERE